ncbi:hypothetical protein BHE74_00009667 [Ensete ventricosum]|nr:hypothetical protein BHE74_00009667 [Ensete ventricosum]
MTFCDNGHFVFALVARHSRLRRLVCAPKERPRWHFRQRHHRLCLRSRVTRFLCPPRVSAGHPTRIRSLSLVMSKHKLQTAVEIHNKCLQKLLVAESDQATDECIFCEHHQSQEHISETGNCRLPVFGSALMGNGQGSSGGGRRPVRIRSAAFDSTQQRQTGLPSTSCQTRPHLEVPRYRLEARHVTAEHPAVMRAEANDIVPRR